MAASHSNLTMMSVHRQDQASMFGGTTSFLRKTPAFLLVLALLFAATPMARAQAYERELNTSAKALLTIKNRTGRVSVIASDSEKDKTTLRATSSTGGTVEPSD